MKREYKLGDKVFILYKGQVEDAIVKKPLTKGKFVVYVLPSYKEIIVTLGIYMFKSQNKAKKAYLRLNGNKNVKTEIFSPPPRPKNSYSVCDQCGSVTTTGKACECSRMA